MIEIRTAQREELKRLRDIAIESYEQAFASFNTRENMDVFLSEAYSLDQLEKEWNEEGSIYYLAWDGDQQVGFARIRRSTEVESQLGKNSIELHRLYVHPDHQGKKVGSALMHHVLDYSVQHGFDWLWLGVWEHNIKAQEFYFKWGFQKFGAHIFQMGDDAQTDWLLRKKLTEPNLVNHI